jgi:hypothetical protein
MMRLIVIEFSFHSPVSKIMHIASRRHFDFGTAFDEICRGSSCGSDHLS